MESRWKAKEISGNVLRSEVTWHCKVHGQDTDPIFKDFCPKCGAEIEVGYTREVKAVCAFCGKSLYDGDDWRNYIPKEIVIERGQDAADVYTQRKDKAICPDCEKDHPLGMYNHDGIMWVRLKEE